MDEIKCQRNPSWNRDELILALELYQRHQGNPPGKSSKEVVELSSLLNKMGAVFANGNADFRNPNGVYMKVMNFRRFDPLYLKQGKKGLERGGKLEAEIWNLFADKQSLLADTAGAIRANVETGSLAELNAVDREEAVEAEEGRILARAHLARERSRKLVEQKKLLAIKNTGKLACEVCAFDFESIYGERGAGFIEAHHVKPVHTLLPSQKTNLKDLALFKRPCAALFELPSNDTRSQTLAYCRAT
jgi:5-methylcytosine-specific restriction protein A